MKTINPLKLGVLVGILNILFPLTGFPQAFKTSIVILSGLVLLYVSLVALHHTKLKRPQKKAIKRAQVFTESKPTPLEEQSVDSLTERPYVE